MARGALPPEERVELALRFELVEVVGPAHMMLADEDLGHRAPTRLLGQLHARLVIALDVDLLVGHALLVEQALGANAVGAPGGRVDLNRLHADWMRPGAEGRKALVRMERPAPIRKA